MLNEQLQMYQRLEKSQNFVNYLFITFLNATFRDVDKDTSTSRRVANFFTSFSLRFTRLFSFYVTTA